MITGTIFEAKYDIDNRVYKIYAISKTERSTSFLAYIQSAWKWEDAYHFTPITEEEQNISKVFSELFNNNKRYEF